MPDYDPKVIHRSSQRLYFSAKITKVLYPATGILLGAGVGFGLFKLAGAVLGGASFGYVGKRLGELKALELESQAQTAICFTRIEEHTRASATTNQPADVPTTV